MTQQEQPKPLLIISSSPHMHSGNTVSAAMREVLLALAPALAASLYYFRTDALQVILACCASAVIAEALCQKIMRHPITITDCSALLTGLLLAFCLPPQINPGLAAFGSACAIVIGKQVFGGLGANIFNPAHIGRAILLASFPAQMTTWSPPVTANTADTVTSASTAAITAATTAATANADAVTVATPLALLREAGHLWQSGTTVQDGFLPELSQLFLGNTAGSLGETCVPALLAGGLFLIWRQVIDWHIPVFYIGLTGIICALYGFYNNFAATYALYHICSGGLIIGAFFMATDWVTSPVTKKGRIIFAVGLAVITSIIRLRGGYIEGVCYSILIMNMLTPLIDRYIINTPFGRGKRHA